jgi:hypothetical protein
MDGRGILRELAERYAEIAQRLDMAEQRELWRTP